MLQQTSTVDKSKTVRYYLIIESKVLPGRSRRTITVNGTSPGPVIWVELGQRVAVSVYNDIDPSDCDDGIKQNAMRNDSSCGTTIHWHGMSQEGSAFNDGVVGLSQCTIPYRQRIVYAFTPTRIGTFWYHGHFNDQYPNGLFGPLVVRPPPAHPLYSRYGYGDPHHVVREEIISVADYYERDYRSLMSEYLAANHSIIDPIPDAFMVNSTFSNRLLINGIDRKQPMILRIINAGVLASYRLSIDGLPLIILEIDGTPVEPMQVVEVHLFVAQRVTLQLNWSWLDDSMKSFDAIWFRLQAIVNGAWPEDVYYGSGSGAVVDMMWKGVLSFSSGDSEIERPDYADKWIPDLRKNFPAIADMNILAAIPLEPTAISSHNFNTDIYHMVINNSISIQHSTRRVKAFINDATFPLEWISPQVDLERFNSELPLLFSVMGYSGTSKQDHPISSLLKNFSRNWNENVVLRPTIQGSGSEPFLLPYDKTIDLTIFGSCCDNHPFHLHGHTFAILGSSDSPKSKALPMERDVVVVPAQGWVKVRFQSNNPGLWLFHCHVHSHMNAGMMALVVEGLEAFQSLSAIPIDHLNICQVSSLDDNTESLYSILLQRLNIVAITLVALLGILAMVIFSRRKWEQISVASGTLLRNKNKGVGHHEMKVLYSSLPSSNQNEDEKFLLHGHDEEYDIWE